MAEECPLVVFLTPPELDFSDLDLHWGVSYFANQGRLGFNSSYDSQEYLQSAGATGLPYVIVGFSLATFVFLFGVLRTCLWKPYHKMAMWYKNRPVGARIFLSTLFMIFSLGAIGLVGAAMAHSAFIFTATDRFLEFLGGNLILIRDSLVWVLSETNALLDQLVEVAPEVPPEIFEDYNIIVNSVRDSVSGLSDAVNLAGDVVESATVLGDVRYYAFVSICTLIAIIFLVLLAPLMSFLAYPTRKKSIWKPIVFGGIAFAALCLSWILVALATIISTLAADFCIVGSAVALKLYAQAEGFGGSEVVPSLPQFVEDLNIQCPSEWGIPMDAITNYLEQLDTSAFDQLVNLFSTSVGEAVDSFTACGKSLISLILLDCRFMANLSGVVVSDVCNPSQSLMKFSSSLYVFLLVIAILFTIMAFLLVPGVKIFDWIQVYERRTDKNFQPPVLLTSLYELDDEEESRSEERTSEDEEAELIKLQDGETLMGYSNHSRNNGQNYVEDFEENGDGTPLP